jgi:hypothetical protein
MICMSTLATSNIELQPLMSNYRRLVMAAKEAYKHRRNTATKMFNADEDEDKLRDCGRKIKYALDRFNVRG